jgi:hypothetical protein
MSKRWRIIIIVASVLMGTFFSFLLVRTRMGTLKPNDWFQLGFNFLFAVAIVVGIGLLLKMRKEKNPKE